MTLTDVEDMVDHVIYPDSARPTHETKCAYIALLRAAQAVIDAAREPKWSLNLADAVRWQVRLDDALETFRKAEEGPQPRP